MRSYVVAAILFSFVPSAAIAKLGGFEPEDGYIDVGDYDPVTTGSFGRDFNVARYNAGEYDETAYPGVFHPLGYQSRANGAGLWERLQGPVTNNNSAYATSHRLAGNVMPHSGQRALVVTTNTNGWTGNSQIYSYQVDAQDLGGLSPTQSDGKVITVSFWVCSEIAGTGTGGGLGPNTRGNYISFWDGSGAFATSGFQVSYLQPGVTDDYPSFRFGDSGPWTDMLGFKVNPHGWHRWDVTLDLAQNLAWVDYLDTQYSATPMNVGSAISIPNMGGLREIRFESTPGVNNAKFFAVDDFGINASPEPTASVMLVLGAAIASARIRRRRIV